MSGVDVLAVLERCRDELKARGQAYVAEQAAIAAVAELIEGFKLIESAKARGFGIDYAQGVAIAALARVAGGDA